MNLFDKRLEIDAIDNDILEDIKKRMLISKEIGEMKKDCELPIRNEKREKVIVSHYRAYALEHGLDPDVMEKICLLLIQESIRIQSKL